MIDAGAENRDEDQPNKAILSPREESILKTAVDLAKVGIIASLVIMGSSITQQHGKRPFFEAAPAEGVKDTYDSLPVNPTLEEVKAFMDRQGITLSSRGDLCPTTYIYHPRTDTETYLDEIEASGEAGFMRDDQALDQGWEPVANFDLQFVRDDATGLDSSAYEQYRVDFEEVKLYLERSLGTCGTAKGDGYDAEAGMFTYPTGPSIDGSNTFYVKA